jgi:predicted RNA-binding protein with PUA-like domain
MLMNYFLAKTEPSTYSIEDFEKETDTVWDGVHNYAAIGFIKQMKPGDVVFVYHSMTDKKIVGVATVVGEPFENKADPRHSWAIKLRFKARLEGPSLKDFKANLKFASFDLVRQSRLSVMTVPNDIARWIYKFAEVEAI